MSEANDTRYLSSRTTPTWEVELLISGVAVFAMLQLPGWLDQQIVALEPRVDAEWRQVLVLSYIYAKSAALVMAATFVLHLLLRAIWIALVGLDSVYPGGVRLDKVKMGPIQSRIMQERDLSLTNAIERADNRASMAFASGVMIAVMIAGVCVVFPAALALLNIAGRAFGWQANAMAIFSAIFVATLVPFVAALIVDRSMGDRLRRDGLAYRLTHRTLGVFALLGVSSDSSLMMTVLATNGGAKRMQAINLGIMFLAAIFAFAGYVAMRKPEMFGSYGLFPASSASRLDTAHYDDQRNPQLDGVLPYVQSRVIRGPYLELTVPYDPLRDQPAMRKCHIPGKDQKEPRADALLACLGKLHAVALDGKPLAELRYEIASDPRSERPALLAMIDVRTLANGRHELRVSRPARADKKPDKDDPDLGFYRIPFWR